MEANQQSTLFSAKALKAQAVKKYGTVNVLPPKHIYFGLCSLLMFIAASVTYFIDHPFDETVEVSGWIQAKQSAVAVRALETSGKVLKVFAQNGEAVSKNQALFEIERAEYRLAGKQQGEHGFKQQAYYLKQKLSLENGLYIQGVQELSNKIEQLNAQINALASEKKAIQMQTAPLIEKRDLLQKQLHKNESLYANNLISLDAINGLKARVHDQNIILSEHHLSLTQLDARLSQLEFSVQQVNSQIRQKKQSHKILTLEIDNKLKQLKSGQSYVIRAPSKGVIDNIRVFEGHDISANQFIAHILPVSKNNISHLLLPASKANLVKAGQTIVLKIDGVDFKKFNGIPAKITHIAEHVIMPEDMLTLPIRSNHPVFLVHAELQNIPDDMIKTMHKVRSGTSIKASIKVQQNTLLNWLLSPFYAIKRA